MYNNSKNGELRQVKNFLTQLELRDKAGSYAAYAEVLQVCTRLKALAEGKKIHGHIVANNYEKHRFLVSQLIIMYGKCGALQEARDLHQRMHKKCAFTWIALIRACAQNGQHKKAVECFKEMLQQDIKPDSKVFRPIVKACGYTHDLEAGKEVHSRISIEDLKLDFTLGNALIRMYRRCGALEEAERVFQEMPGRNVVSWNSMILGYVENGFEKKALEHFHKMREEMVKPSCVTYAMILDFCGGMLSLEETKEVHANIVSDGLEGNERLGTALVRMYGRFGKMNEARDVFSKVKERNFMSWTAMVTACNLNGYHQEALHLFRIIHHEGMKSTLSGSSLTS